MIVWDESKRQRVIKVHAIDFARMLDVFDDPYGVYREDLVHSKDERRFSVTGITGYYGMVFAVFAFVDDQVRLITARRAEKWMVEEYEKEL